MSRSCLLAVIMQMFYISQQVSAACQPGDFSNGKLTGLQKRNDSEVSSFVKGGAPSSKALEMYLNQRRTMGWDASFEPFAQNYQTTELFKSLQSAANFRLKKLAPATSNAEVVNASYDLARIFMFIGFLCDTQNGINFLFEVLENRALPDRIREDALVALITVHEQHVSTVLTRLQMALDAFSPRDRERHLTQALYVFRNRGNQSSIAYLRSLKAKAVNQREVKEIESAISALKKD